MGEREGRGRKRRKEGRERRERERGSDKIGVYVCVSARFVKRSVVSISLTLDGRDHIHRQIHDGTPVVHVLCTPLPRTAHES